MTYNKQLSFWFLTICLPALLTAQSRTFFSDGYYVEQFTASDGLPGTSVADIIQDARGFLWLATHDGLARYDGFQFEVFRVDTSGGFTNFFYTLRQDRRGKIWAGTLNRGVYLFDPEKEQFTHHFRHSPEEDNSLCSDWISSIEEGPKGAIWVETSDGWSRIGTEGGRLAPRCYSGKKTSPGSGPIFSNNDYIAFPVKNELWFVWKHGIKVLSYENEKPAFRSILFPAGTVELAKVTAVARSRDGLAWIAGKAHSEEGTLKNVIKKWDTHRHTFKALSHAVPGDVAINHLYEDRKGNLWLGTWGRGVFLLRPPFRSNMDTEHIALFSDESAQKGNVWSFLPDRFGNLWVGAWRGHLFKVHLGSDAASLTRLPLGQGRFAVPGNITEDAGGNIWISTNEGFLFRQPAARGSLRRFRLPLPKAARTIDIPIPLVAAENAIWLGAYNGLIQFFPDTGKSELFEIRRADEGLPKDWAGVLVKQGDTLWCGTTHGSLYSFSLSSLQFQAWHEEYTNLGVINDILISSDGFLLASTSKGLHRIDISNPDNRSFLTQYTGGLDLLETAEGSIWLSSYLGGLRRVAPEGKPFTGQDDTYLSWLTGIESDSQGRLWLAGPNGLIRFNPLKNDTETFTGLNCFTFPKTAAVIGKHKARNGYLFLAGEEGVMAFHPDSIRRDPVFPTTVIKSIWANNRDIRGIEEFNGLPAPPYLKAVLLSYDKNDVTIEYTGLQFNQPESIRYRYRLEGLQEEWVEAGKERTARFSNLPPGAYTFRVKAANGDGVWEEAGATLALSILPPWWRRWWAYAIYCLSTLAAIVVFYRFQLNRRLAVEEARRLTEMDSLKTRLYTNITHEFRTPLTVIMGMAEQSKVYFRAQAADKFEPAIQAVQRNARQLLRLANQMLDLSRAEAGALEINLIRDDAARFLQYVAESFRSLAESKGIHLAVHKEQGPLFMDFDPDKLYHIASNLLSNAIKYTPEGGKVILRISAENRNGREWLLLQVKDNGIGIEPEQLPHVFDRFYRAPSSARGREEAGIGIGLALTKEMVELLNGQVKAESIPGKGSTFTARLPIQRNATVQKAEPLSLFTAAPPIPADSFSSLPGEQHTLLIVEDNPDVQAYLQACLEGQYQIIKAGNGREGIDKALEIVPDLIISDVMMPEKDGFELCRHLKENERTSHIPIVLLTARADEASRLEGLEGGADAYLPKPFNQKELFIRLRKLIELRQRLQYRYQQAAPFSLPSEAAFSREDEFIKKVQAQMKAHLSDETFGVRELARELAMSRSQVFKKLKALTGQSIAQYMRNYRLHCARQLLESSSLSVSEVAYAVGFRDPAYFSRVFSEAFGSPPSEVRK